MPDIAAHAATLAERLDAARTMADGEAVQAYIDLDAALSDFLWAFRNALESGEVRPDIDHAPTIAGIENVIGTTDPAESPNRHDS